METDHSKGILITSKGPHELFMNVSFRSYFHQITFYGRGNHHNRITEPQSETFQTTKIESFEKIVNG